MRKIITANILFFFLVFSIVGQKLDTVSRFNTSINFGLSCLAPLDLSLRLSSPLTKIDSRVVPNIGLGIRWNLLKSAKFRPSIEVGFNTFRSKATNLEAEILTNAIEFRNRFCTYSIKALLGYDANIGVGGLTVYLGGFRDQTFLLFPYAKDSQGEEYRGFESKNDKPGGSRYKGPINIGLTLGVEMLVKKLRLGMFLDQRLYFSGFNREISRLSLRIGF